MSRLHLGKTVSAESAESGSEIQNIDSMEKELGEVGEKTQQIRVLISRSTDLSHYRAFDDISFIVEAIGKKDYPGSPALDVLPSQDDIDRERKEKTNEYIYCIISWAEGKNIEDAVGEFKASEKLLRNTYIHLGELDKEKKWLAMCLAKTLKEKVSSPEDIVSELSDEEFVTYVYKTILGREPDSDDLNLKLMELTRGKTRQELIRNVLESRESSRQIMAEIAKAFKQPSGS